jgi:hypothetical protein
MNWNSAHLSRLLPITLGFFEVVGGFSRENAENDKSLEFPLISAFGVLLVIL